MDNGYATLRCVLKVHSGCDACKRHTMEILGSIVGVYDFTMESERNTARISGQVDPNFCMKAIARCDGHAQVLWANLSHPKMQSASYGHDYGYDPPRILMPEAAGTMGHGHGYGYGHDYPYPATSTSYQQYYPPQPHQYSSYPQPPPMDYYCDQDYSLCTIM